MYSEQVLPSHATGREMAYTQEQIVNIFVTALETAGYSISQYLLAYDHDIDATVLKNNTFAVNIRKGKDIEQSGGNIQVPVYIDFIFCFSLPLVIEGTRASTYITRSTTTIESVKDIVRRQQVGNFYISEGDTPLPASNVQDFLFIKFAVYVEVCHNYKE